MLSNKDYHARPEISKSDLDLLARSPLHLKLKNELKNPPSEALILGSAVHKIVLERKDFSNEFKIAPAADKRTKEGKAIHEEFFKKLGEKTPINWASIRTAIKIASSIRSMEETAFFLKDGLAEQSYFSEIEGVAVKCRPDFYNEKMGAVIDLKTTSDASASGFARSVASFNYHVQAAFYSDILRSLGKEVNYFLFIAVETKAPYFVGFYELDTAAIEQGRKTYLELLELYKYCKERDEWWGYAKKDGDKINAVQTLSLPAWKLYEQIA